MIEFVQVPGQYNPMAVCSECGRHGGETLMTRYCEAASPPYPPLLCDECHVQTRGFTEEPKIESSQLAVRGDFQQWYAAADHPDGRRLLATSTLSEEDARRKVRELLA
jgi:hypothetical protein